MDLGTLLIYLGNKPITTTIKYTIKCDLSGYLFHNLN